VVRPGGFEDAADDRGRRQARRRRRRHEPGIGRETRVGVDLQDMRLSLFVQAQIDPPVARDPADPRGFERQAARARGQRLVGGRREEAALGVAVGEGVRLPFRLVAHDARQLVRPGVEDDLGDRQRREPIAGGEQRDVELAPRQVALDEQPLPGKAKGQLAPARERFRAVRHHRGAFEPERGVLAGRLHDPWRRHAVEHRRMVEVEAAARRHRQTLGGEQRPGRQLVGGQPERGGRRAGEGEIEQLEDRGGAGMDGRVSGRRLDQVEDQQAGHGREAAADLPPAGRERRPFEAEGGQAGADQLDLREHVAGRRVVAVAHRVVSDQHARLPRARRGAPQRARGAALDPAQHRPHRSPQASRMRPIRST
jgi:hypothetical protein